MYSMFKKYDISATRENPVNEKKIDTINANYELYSSVIAYIDEQEWFCTALLRGVMDEDYAFGAVSTQTIGAYDTLGKFILHRRNKLKSEIAYKDFEVVVKNWKEKQKISRPTR